MRALGWMRPATRTQASATVSSAEYSLRVRAAPRRTASVRLPCDRSVGMSRRLLATRIAEAMAPTPTAPAIEAGLTDCACV